METPRRKLEKNDSVNDLNSSPQSNSPEDKIDQRRNSSIGAKLTGDETKLKEMMRSCGFGADSTVVDR